MKRTTLPACAAAILLPLAALLLVAGCESADDYTVDVTPPYADLYPGSPRVTLSATGWSDYTWELDPNKKDIGFLSATHGESVVYTAVQFPVVPTNDVPVTPIMQTVTVSARNVVTSSGSTSTGSVSTVSNVYTGEVIIRHLNR